MGPVIWGKGRVVHMKGYIKDYCIFFARFYNDFTRRDVQIWNKASYPTWERKCVIITLFLIQRFFNFFWPRCDGKMITISEEGPKN